ncbi:uncharacterized protein [Miscanthus floridulus]|uniref:uncharacterized protein n=1 Tax=Miscanthus floridulus TaxID=154761 RepID=UPI003457A6ED
MVNPILPPNAPTVEEDPNVLIAEDDGMEVDAKDKPEDDEIEPFEDDHGDGLMSIKHIEFMKLTQGTKSLTEYLHAFNNLSRYATKFADTEAKKIASFKRGHDPKLMKTLANNKSATFNEFISDALTQDNQNNIYVASKNRKRAFEAGASQSKAPVVVRPQFHPPAPKFRPPQKKVQTVQNQKVVHKAYSIALPKGGSGQGSSNVPPSNLPCWNCNKPGHWARNYPIPKRTTRSRVIPMCIRDMCTIQLLKKFLLVKLLLRMIVTIDKGSYYLSVVRNQISTNQIVRDVCISISNQEYTIDLVVLSGLEIDVILGMIWMSGHGVLIDTSTQVVMLRELDSKNAFLVPLPRDFDLQNVANAIQLMTIADNPMVCEFLDMFLNELPGLPLDRDV